MLLERTAKRVFEGDESPRPIDSPDRSAARWAVDENHFPTRFNQGERSESPLSAVKLAQHQEEGGGTPLRTEDEDMDGGVDDSLPSENKSSGVLSTDSRHRKIATATQLDIAQLINRQTGINTLAREEHRAGGRSCDALYSRGCPEEALASAMARPASPLARTVRRALGRSSSRSISPAER